MKFCYCVYCEYVYQDIFVCPRCNEYDGLNEITYDEATQILISQVIAALS